MAAKPVNQSPSEWARLDAGLTETGLLIYCKRCRLEVGHFTPAELEALLASKPACERCGEDHATADHDPTGDHD